MIGLINSKGYNEQDTLHAWERRKKCIQVFGGNTRRTRISGRNISPTFL
jgi:hypothetical protein